MKNLLSPLQLQNFKKGLKEKLDITNAATALVNVHEKFIKKIDEVDNLVNKKVGPKGEKGDRGPKGEKGDKGDMPDVEAIIKFVQSKLPSVKDGSPGKDGLSPQKGIHYFTAEDQLHIAKLAANFVKLDVPKEVEIDPMKIVEAIEKLPVGKRLSAKNIDGLSQTISAISNQTKRGYLHGGGDTIVAGTNITITINANGTKTINSSAAAFPQMTTVQRLALSPINGQTAFDTNLNVAMIYINGYWGTVLLN